MSYPALIEAKTVIPELTTQDSEHWWWSLLLICKSSVVNFTNIYVDHIIIIVNFTDTRVNFCCMDCLEEKNRFQYHTFLWCFLVEMTKSRILLRCSPESQTCYHCIRQWLGTVKWTVNHNLNQWWPRSAMYMIMENHNWFVRFYSYNLTLWCWHLQHQNERCWGGLVPKLTQLAELHTVAATSTYTRGAFQKRVWALKSKSS